MEKISTRMRRSGVCKGFSTWQEHVAKMQRHKKVVDKVLMRMKKSCICKAAKAWVTWQEHVAELQRHKDVID